MARLINADQAVAEADRLLELYSLAMAGAETNREINHIVKRQELFKAVRAVVKTCPTQDAAKHGHWNTVEDVVTHISCSECGGEIYWFQKLRPKFCPYCGSKNGRC